MRNTPERTRLAISVLVCGLVLLAAGCGTKAGPKPPDEALPEPSITLPAAEPDDLAAVRMPLDSYGVTDDQATVLFDAKEKALGDCMRAKGFTYHSSAHRPAADRAWLDPDNLGLTSTKQAPKTGYHRPPVSRGAGNTPATDQSAAYDKALSGVAGPPAAGTTPSGGRGCQGTADDRLNPPGGAPSKITVVDGLRGKAFTAAVNDSRVKAAKTAWSQCMNKQGYRYANPAEPLAAPWPDPVGSDETATAVADMRCKKQVRLLGTWVAVLSGYQQTLISQSAVALQGVQEATRARIDRAKAVLGGAS